MSSSNNGRFALKFTHKVKSRKFVLQISSVGYNMKEYEVVEKEIFLEENNTLMGEVVVIPIEQSSFFDKI